MNKLLFYLKLKNIYINALLQVNAEDNGRNRKGKDRDYEALCMIANFGGRGAIRP